VRSVKLSLLIKVWVSETKGESSASDLQLRLSYHHLGNVMALEASSCSFGDPSRWCLMLARSGNGKDTSRRIGICRVGIFDQSGSGSGAREFAAIGLVALGPGPLFTSHCHQAT
jgi:hypothetical protein